MFKNNDQYSNNGFTLVEILIVIFIIAAMASVFVPSLNSNPQKQIKRDLRSFSLTVKDIRNRANIENKTYRIVFNFDQETNPKYIVEAADGRVLLQKKEDTRDFFETLKKQKKEKSVLDKNTEKNSFSETDRFPAKEFPKGLFLRKVEISGVDTYFEEGPVAIYIMPEGYMDEVSLQFGTKEDKLKWTLLTIALTGQVDTLDGFHDLKDFREF